MLFEYIDSILQTRITHYANGEYNRIKAYADTGCSNTQIGINSLSRLLKRDVDSLREELERTDISFRKEAYTADGSPNTTVRTLVANILIDGFEQKRLPQLRCVVNLNDCWNGAPYILLGLDFLLMFDECILRDRKLTCNGFDNNRYNSYIDRYNNASIKLYSSVEVDGVKQYSKPTVSDLLIKARGD